MLNSFLNALPPVAAVSAGVTVVALPASKYLFSKAQKLCENSMNVNSLMFRVSSKLVMASKAVRHASIAGGGFGGIVFMAAAGCVAAAGCFASACGNDAFLNDAVVMRVSSSLGLLAGICGGIWGARDGYGVGVDEVNDVKSIIQSRITALSSKANKYTPSYIAFCFINLSC